MCRLDSPETGGVLNELQARAHGISRRRVATHVERNDRTEALQLAARRSVRGMARQPRIAGQRDAGMAREAVRERHGVLLGAREADGKRAHTADGEERFEGTRCRAGEFPGVPEGAEQRRVCHRDDATEQVRVPAEELRD